MTTDKSPFRPIVFWVTTVCVVIHTANLLLEPRSTILIDCGITLTCYLGLVWGLRSGRLDRLDPMKRFPSEKR